ncbi:MAG: hypothetical protein ABH829_05170 [archaeon]
MVHKTAVIVAATTVIAAQYLPYKYALLVGAFLVMLPLRLTIMPGNLISQTAIGTSLLTLLGLHLGFGPFYAFAFGVTARFAIFLLIVTFILKSMSSKPRLPKFLQSNKVQPTVMKQYPGNKSN